MLHQALVNQAQPQRGVPTPQQNFVSLATPQLKLNQISSHVPADGLPPNGVLGQMNDAPPQQSPQITHSPSRTPMLLRGILAIPVLRACLCFRHADIPTL